MSVQTPQLISKSRLESLSDGVFAVVMTILVLQLGGSAISNAETSTQLDSALLAQWPTFVSYTISFLVAGLYWVSHHTYFTFIRGINETQLWLNLLFLFCLSFIPFAADLIGDHPYFRAGAMLYGLNLTACTGALYLNWHYAWNRGHVLVKDADPLVTGVFKDGRYAPPLPTSWQQGWRGSAQGRDFICTSPSWSFSLSARFAAKQ